jgi:DNA-directed RNA polymerase specialized sigma24 family protein
MSIDYCIPRHSTATVDRGASERIAGLAEALERLGRVHPVKAKVFLLHRFGGLSFLQTARVLGVSEPTAKRYWSYARAWVGREMSRRGTGFGVGL